MLQRLLGRSQLGRADGRGAVQVAGLLRLRLLELAEEDVPDDARVAEAPAVVVDRRDHACALERLEQPFESRRPRSASHASGSARPAPRRSSRSASVRL
jgi:hypothetical protein